MVPTQPLRYYISSILSVMFRDALMDVPYKAVFEHTMMRLVAPHGIQNDGAFVVHTVTRMMGPCSSHCDQNDGAL